MLVFLNRFERNRAGAMFCVALFCRWFFFCSIPFSPKQMLRSIDAFFIVVNFTSRSLGFFFILVRLFRLLVISFILSLHAEHEVFCQSAKDTCVHFLYKLIEPLVTIPNRGEAHIVVVVVAVFFFVIFDSRFFPVSVYLWILWFDRCNSTNCHS